MVNQGIPAKHHIEGPPKRKVPILLRQTSFQAIQEPIVFVSSVGESTSGKHRARFGEIEERGAALTPKGKALYEELLFKARKTEAEGLDNNAYQKHLATVFESFPDNLATMIKKDLIYVRYEAVRQPSNAQEKSLALGQLIAQGLVTCKPLVYEDFLSVFFR